MPGAQAPRWQGAVRHALGNQRRPRVALARSGPGGQRHIDPLPLVQMQLLRRDVDGFPPRRALAPTGVECGC
eukprot:11777750-Alexandrium_andersonii.AAC.1